MFEGNKGSCKVVQEEESFLDVIFGTASEVISIVAAIGMASLMITSVINEAKEYNKNITKLPFNW